MTIKVRCTCGKSLKAPDNLAGKKGTCPGCGKQLTIPAAPGGGSQLGSGGLQEPPLQAPQQAPGVPDSAPPSIAPPPSTAVRVPSTVPERLRSPGSPPCWLNVSAESAVVKTTFAIDPVLTAFVEAVAKHVKKRFDLNIGSPPPNAAPVAEVRVLRVDAGNQALRYLLTFLAGKTCFEISGHVNGTTQQQVPFHFQNKCSGGFFGGNSLKLLKLNAQNLGKRVAKAIIKASR